MQHTHAGPYYIVNNGNHLIPCPSSCQGIGWPLKTGKVSQNLTKGEENKLRRKTTSNDVELKLVGADVVEELQHHMITSWMSYMKKFLKS